MKISKSIILCLFLLTAISVAKGQPVNSQANGQNSTSTADISFDKLVHDYGMIKKGSDGSCEFLFKNTGKEPLVLNNVRSSCGCTVPTWPKDPILPGKSDVIKVVYDTKRIGMINKTITVTSNAKTSTVTLTIKGMVQE